MHVQQLPCARVGVSTASQNGDESVWIQLDDHRLVVVITAECVQPPQTACLTPRGLSSVPLGTTSEIRSPPGPRRIQQWNNISTPPYAFMMCIGTTLPYLLPQRRGWSWPPQNVLYSRRVMCIRCGNTSNIMLSMHNGFINSVLQEVHNQETAGK
jgi:hypothetical protein